MSKVLSTTLIWEPDRMYERAYGYCIQKSLKLCAQASGGTLHLRVALMQSLAPYNTVCAINED
jgi:hypothetical protein